MIRHSSHRGPVGESRTYINLRTGEALNTPTQCCMAHRFAYTRHQIQVLAWRVGDVVQIQDPKSGSVVFRRLKLIKNCYRPFIFMTKETLTNLEVIEAVADYEHRKIH